VCADLVGQLVPVVSDMSPAVQHIHDTLSGIKRKLLEMRSSRDFTSDSVHHYQQMLDAIDAKRVDGIFSGDPAACASGPGPVRGDPCAVLR